MQPALVVITPVYEDKEASGQLFVELARLFGRSVFVVAVDDGSVRTPLEVTSLVDAGLEGVVIRLKRNIGHQQAIAVGLSYAAENLQHCERFVVMPVQKLAWCIRANTTR